MNLEEFAGLSQLNSLCCDTFNWHAVITYMCPWDIFCMMTSHNGNIFCVTDPLGGESTSHQWIPLTKASDAELWCFLWCESEETVMLTVKMPVIWDTMALIVTSLLCTEFCTWDIIVRKLWWHHEVGPLSTSLALCGENPLVSGGFSHRGAVMWNFYVSFYVRLKELLINIQIAGDWRHPDAHVTSL